MEGFGDDFEEIREQFMGDWRITKVNGYTEAELHEGEPARLTFWEDETAELVCAGHDVDLDVQFDETVDGLAAVAFKGRGRAGQKRVTVSGLGAIRHTGKTLEGSLRIGGRARAFTAQRDQ